MNTAERTVLVLISGRVQGVWFRDWTRRRADELGLAGWVRNRRDHKVEALFHGSGQGIDEMIEKCHDGPRLSRVDEVVVREHDGYDRQGFEIRETV